MYLDYFFLNPVHGHFIDSDDLVGAHIREVLSRSNCRVLGRAIMEAWKFQEDRDTVLTFQRDRREYQANIHCISSKQGHILGLVVDTLQGEKQDSASKIAWPIAHYERLTINEKAILTEMKLQPIFGFEESAQTNDETKLPCIRTGLSNEELAQKRKITIRTVKAHVTHIYEKLQVVSPHHRAIYRQSQNS